MTLPEYRNLTQDELEWADHCAESGNMNGLRRMQEISANREGKDAQTNNPERYHNPIVIVPNN